MKINGQTHYLWRAVGHEGEALEAYVTIRRDLHAALKFLRIAMKIIGNEDKKDVGRRLNNGAENSCLPLRRRERTMLRFRRM